MGCGVCGHGGEDSHSGDVEGLPKDRDGKVNGGKARVDGMRPKGRTELAEKAARTWCQKDRQGMSSE